MKKKPKRKTKAKADPRLLMINSLGEVFKKGEYIVGSVNCADLEKRLGHKPVPAEIDAEFERIISSALPWGQFAFVKLVWHLQTLNNSRFRIYGWIEKELPEKVILVTEFCWWVDDKAYWKKLAEKAKRLGATLRVLHVGPHCDKKGKRNLKTGKIKWRTGRHHGRPEKQVEMVWDLADIIRGERGQEFMLNQVVQEMMALAFHTHDVWKQSGVGVC